jgi:hypothetical protein
MEDTQPLAVPLQTGWNMIGNPFLQAVERDLSAIQVQKGTEKKSLTGAQEAGWIEDFAWGWEGSAYRLIYDPSVVPQAEGVLNPWQGYWVKANQDCTLLLPPPGIESTVEAPGEVTLAWPELGRTSSRDASFTLVDLTTGTRRYMRTTSGYTYHPSRGETQRRFQIVAEPGPGNPLQITALQATPTRGPERGAQITFQLNRSAATEVTVLTLTGRVVSPIEQGRTRTAGLQQAVWTGQDEEGRPVPPGVYLVEVVATDEEGQQVRAVRTVRMP